MKINFRAIVKEDYDFLWQLHNAALREYVEKTWGWNEDWQKQNFAANFNPGDGVIIVYENEDVGFLWKIEKGNEILLASIRILPEYQNKGIGTKIIKDLLASSNKNVRLQVLKVNPARNLYARLGFVIKDETDTHFVMERKSTDD
ncbi:MAG TPA: GNAT family N-acetyltransferase [Pyrinomonadaceae bacterium]|jgi:ribosomal protein S18 acetylase RimI-like enzyme